MHYQNQANQANQYTQPAPQAAPQVAQNVPQAAPEYMQAPAQAAPAPTQPAVNKFAFTVDTKTAQIIRDVSPEMVNAMVAIALKKFSTTQDFIDFFVQNNIETYLPAVAPEPEISNQEQEVEHDNHYNAPVAAPAVAISFDDFG